MKKLAILFLFIFVATIGFSQSPTQIEDTLNGLSDVEMYQMIIDGTVPSFQGDMHDAFVENPQPLADAVLGESEIRTHFITYASTDDPAHREELETKLVTYLYN